MVHSTGATLDAAAPQQEVEQEGVRPWLRQGQDCQQENLRAVQEPAEAHQEDRLHTSSMASKSGLRTGQRGQDYWLQGQESGAPAGTIGQSSLQEE
eukprot:6969100-Heterocapsa_arctica.AAC.1